MATPPATGEDGVEARRYEAEVVSVLHCFDRAKEWADLGNCLQRLLKVLSRPWPASLSYIPHRLTVSKRLAQCLNPQLPSGVHSLALEVFAAILRRIGPQGLSVDLSLWAAGFFAFSADAAAHLRPFYLHLLDAFFLPLGRRLLPCLSGLTVSLLLCMEEEKAQTFAYATATAERLQACVGTPAFASALWLALLRAARVRIPAIRLINKLLETPLTTQPEERVSLLLPDRPRLVIGALEEALGDESNLVQRDALDLLLRHFPLYHHLLTTPERVRLICAVLALLPLRDWSLTRRAALWLSGQGEKGTEETDIPFSVHVKADLLLAVRESLSVSPVSRSAALLPLKSLAVYLADEETEGAAEQLMPALSVPVLQYLHRESSTPEWGSACLQEAQQVFHLKLTAPDVVWRALAQELRAVLQQQEQQDGGSEDVTPAAADTWPAAEAARAEAAAAAEGVLQLATLFADKIAAPLAVAAASSGAADAAAICGIQTLHGFALLLTPILQGCRELSPTLQQLPLICRLLQEAAAYIRRLRALRENGELLLLLRAAAAAPPDTLSAAARAAAAAPATVSFYWRGDRGREAAAGAEAGMTLEAADVGEAEGETAEHSLSAAAAASAAAVASTEFTASPDALQPSLQQLLQQLLQLVHAIDVFLCFAEALFVELSTTEDAGLQCLDTLFAMPAPLVELQCCMEDIGYSSSSSSNCLPSWLLALLDCVACPRLSVCCKAAQTFVSILNSSSSSRRRHLICETDQCLRVASRLWECLGSSSCSSSEGLVVDLLLQLYDACLPDRPAVIESIVLADLESGSSSSSSMAESIWRFSAFWRHGRLQLCRPLGLLLPNAVLQLLAALANPLPDVRYAARVFVRLALETPTQLLRPVFAHILANPPPLQQRQLQQEDAAAAAEAAAEARHALQLLQLLLQCEGPLLLERMQTVFVEEELLQLNARQAQMWTAATSAGEAAATAAVATATAAAADWRLCSYDDFSVVDLADLFCVALLRIISFQLPPAAAATAAGAAEASSSFAAMHGTACELLGFFLASIQPAARAREISCLLSHPLVQRLHAAIHAADYAAQSQLLQLLRVVIVHSSQGDTGFSPASHLLLSSSSNELHQMLRQQVPQRRMSTSAAAEVAAAAAAAAAAAESATAEGAAASGTTAETTAAIAAAAQQQQQQQEDASCRVLRAEFPLFALGAKQMRSKLERLVPLSSDFGGLLRGLLMAIIPGETAAPAARDAAIEEATQLSLFLLQHVPAAQLQPVFVVLLDFFCRLLLRAAIGRCAKSRAHSSSSSSSLTSRMLLPYLRGILGVLTFSLDFARKAEQAKDAHAETSGLTPFLDLFSWGSASLSEEDTAQEKLQQRLPAVAAAVHLITSACVAAANLILPPLQQQQQQQRRRTGAAAAAYSSTSSGLSSSRCAQETWPSTGMRSTAAMAAAAASNVPAAAAACSPEQQQFSDCHNLHLTHADEAALSLLTQILDRLFGSFRRDFVLSCLSIWTGGLSSDGANLRSLLLLLRLMRGAKLKYLLVPLIAISQEAARGVTSVPVSPSLSLTATLPDFVAGSAAAAAAATAAAGPPAATAAAIAAAEIGKDSISYLLSQVACAETPRPRESVIAHFIYCLLLAAFPPPFVTFKCLCSSACHMQRQLPPLETAAATAALPTEAEETAESSSTTTRSSETEVEEIWRLMFRLVAVAVSSVRQPLSLLWVFCIVTALDRSKPAKEHLLASKKVRRDLGVLFQLCCFVGCRTFSLRVSTAANPNAYDVMPPLPPPIDILNQALAVPAAAAAPAASRRHQAAAAVAPGVFPAIPTPAAETRERLQISSSSSSSSRDSELLLLELQHRREQHRCPSFSVSSCITAANKELHKRNVSASRAAPADAAEVAAVYGLAALVMQCADLRQLNRRSPLSGLFLQTLTDELASGLGQALNNNSPQAFLSRYLLASLLRELPLRLFPAASSPLRRVLLEGLHAPLLFLTDRRTLRAWGDALHAVLASDTYKLDTLIPPPNAGVFASREREGSGRASYLKRIAFLLLAAAPGTFASQVASLLEKLAETLKTNYPHEIAALVTQQVFLCVRVLLLRLSPPARMPVWPIVLTELSRIFSGGGGLEAGGPGAVASHGPPLSLLHAGLKVVELATLLELPDFTLYRWIFLAEDLHATPPTSQSELLQQQQQQQLPLLPQLQGHGDTEKEQQQPALSVPFKNILQEEDEQQQQQQQKLQEETSVAAAAASAEGRGEGHEPGQQTPRGDEVTTGHAATAAAATTGAADNSSKFVYPTVCQEEGEVRPVPHSSRSSRISSTSSRSNSTNSSSSSSRSLTDGAAASTTTASFQPFLCLLAERYEQQQQREQQDGTPQSQQISLEADHSDSGSGRKGHRINSSSSNSNSLAAAARRLNQRAAAEPRYKTAADDEQLQRSIEDDLLEGPEELRDMWLEVSLPPLLQQQWCLYTSGIDLLLPAPPAFPTDAADQGQTSP